jgi:hypothetical protein
MWVLRTLKSRSVFFKIARIFLLIGMLSTQIVSAGTADGLEMKYMYFSDRNEVWNHTPAIEYIKRVSTYWSMQYDQELDAVSGASRRLGLRNIGRLGENGSKLDAVSGASQREFRHSEQATASYANQGRLASASFYFSDEDDYRSLSPSFSGAWDFNARNTTLGGAAAFFFDDFHPKVPFTGQGGKRFIGSYTLNLTQILTPLSLVNFTLNTIHSSGYLGHMYNAVITTKGSVVEEHLPNNKNSVAVATKFIQGFRGLERLGSIHIEARNYHDGWGLGSNTLDIQWYQYIFESLYFRLRARGYQQDAAEFAKDRYDGNENFRTADIRYSAFSNLTLGLKLGSNFPESWNDSPLLPDRWDLSYDHLVRNTKGEFETGLPTYHYQLFPEDQYYSQGTLLAGIAFDL